MASGSIEEEWETRFAGIARLYGTGAPARLRSARVMVVGIGGVGSWVAESLARSGVGSIRLVDIDEICASNANRQIHTDDQSVGRLKVEVMAERVRRINPCCKVATVEDFFTAHTIEAVWGEGAGWVVDAIDNARNKALLIATARERGARVVSVGGMGGRVDPGALIADDLARSGRDALLRRTRALLRKEYGFAPKGDWGVACVYSREPAREPTDAGAAGARLDCAGGFGAASFVTGAAAFRAASIVVNGVAEP